MRWSYEVRLLTDKYVLGDTIKWLTWTVVLFGVFMLLLFGLSEGVQGIQMALMITGGVAICLALIAISYPLTPAQAGSAAERGVDHAPRGLPPYLSP